MATIFLTGATGYIGGSIAARLLQQGDQVRGLVRSPDSAALLKSRGIQPVIGDLNNLPLLTQEARQADAVINTASADHEAAVRSLLAGLETSSKPFIHTSGSSVVGDDARGAYRSEQVFDEDTPFVVSPAKQPRRDIDLMVLGAAANGVRSMVICPSLIYGTGRGISKDSVQIPFLAANARRQGAVQIVGAGLNVWSNVHLDDVVELYRLALGDGKAGALYFAENGESSFADIGRALAARLGLPGPESLDPDAAAREWGELKAYYSLGSNSRVRGRRARQELHWSPRHHSALDWIANDMPAAP